MSCINDILICMKRLLIILCLLPCLIHSKVVLPPLIGDNMVLQQNANIKLWGKSIPNYKLRVMLEWSKDDITVDTDNDGSWSVMVKSPKAGGPYNISFIDKDTLTLKNIYIGEVWLCSGQSNMQMPMKGNVSQPVLESNRHILEADENIPIRMFDVERKASIKIIEEVNGKWRTNRSENVANFSAVAYFYGLELYRKLKVPIGLINASWGASNIESWMPADTLKLLKDVSLEHLKTGDIVKMPQQKGTLLYNGMLYPLKDYSIKGVIWYQGESNVLRYDSYCRLMESFVGHLRFLFRNPNMPFYYAQIAPFGHKNEYYSALLREAQFKAEKVIPNSGMAVLMDIGEEKCIHPSNKKKVGERLAYLALSRTYGIKGIYSSAPSYKGMKIINNKVTLFFDNSSMGFTSFGRGLNHFEISDKYGDFVKAKAQIKNNTIVVWNDSVKNPVNVRYGFKNYVDGDLFGISGLPVSSFRTDTLNFIK